MVAGAFCVGSLYWTGVTFGAVTVMQAVGHDAGLVLMERSDPLFLLVSLPLLPVVLVMGKMVRWEEPVISHLATLPRAALTYLDKDNLCVRLVTRRIFVERYGMEHVHTVHLHGLLTACFNI